VCNNYSALFQGKINEKPTITENNENEKEGAERIFKKKTQLLEIKTEK